MKLEGSLDAFSLPDIFQLLSYTKKTGGLRLQHAGTHGVVYFVDGAVSGAHAEGTRQALARRLIGLGLVDDDAVAAAVAEAVASGATPSGGGVVSALIRTGAVSAETVAPIAYDQLHDSVFELMRWANGDFQFAGDHHDPDDVGLRLPSEEVVTRASEQRVRWGAASAVVPSPEAVPTLATALTAEAVVRTADWSVLRLVDGRRQVAEIVDLAGAGQLATVVALADLVERGLVELAAAGADDPLSATLRRFELLAPAEAAAPPPVGDAPSPAPAPPVPADPAVAAEAPAPVELFAPAEPFAPASTVVTIPEPAPAADRAPDLTADLTTDLTAEPFAGPTATAPRLGGAHAPGDVVPPRVEPFLGTREPEFAEPVGPGPRPTPSGRPSTVAAGTLGNTAIAVAANGDALIERDPSVNRSLLLRLIAGVRGL